MDPDWLMKVLGIVGLPWVWRVVKKGLGWLKPVGLTRGKPLFFTIGETAYIAPFPYVPEREVSDVVTQVHIGNPDTKRPRTVATFRLNVVGKPAYPVSEARRSERNGGWYLVPSGGGFSSVPSKDYMRLPITVPTGGAVVGWIGFCLAERRDLTWEEAWNIDAEVVSVEADGTEISCLLPACELPRQEPED